MPRPEVCVLKTDGTNGDMEMAYAFEVSGGESQIVHVNQLRDSTKRLTDFDVLTIPGGFSYGDDIASGRVLANELTSYLAEEIDRFVEDEKPILGVCNGFQVLLKTGLLPNLNMGHQTMTLTHNENGRFEWRWSDHIIGDSVCRFAQEDDFIDAPIAMQVAHGEGRFWGRGMDVLELAERRQVVFQYSRPDSSIPDGVYPDNPNGSSFDIAGICDPRGTILGMMPHPERSFDSMHPHRARTEEARNAASILFSNIVKYAKEL